MTEYSGTASCSHANFAWLQDAMPECSVIELALLFVNREYFATKKKRIRGACSLCRSNAEKFVGMILYFSEPNSTSS